MNLNVSPDLDARYCYVIVFACGVIASGVQIYRRLRLRNVTGIWLEPGTWMLLGIYLSVPIALFWLMDRYGALNDSGLFAAVLIGAAYPAILSGGFGGIKAPDGLTAIWKPIDGLADTVTTWITNRTQRNSRRFETWIVSNSGVPRGISLHS